MRFSPRKVLSDVFFILCYRMKLVCKDIITMLVLGVSVLLFALMVRSLSVSAQDLSSLPIGVIDNDNSVSSAELVSGLAKAGTIRIVEGTEGELYKQLMDEMITSYFVIEKGYEAQLKSGNPKKMISMYYKDKNKSASIIADIVAGEIIYPVSLYKSYRHYEKLEFTGEKLSLSQYEEFLRNFIGSSEDFNFAFQMIYRNPVIAQSPDKPVSNSVMYNQFIIGLLGIMTAFIAMFILSQIVTEKENGVDLRLKATGFHILKKDLGDLGAVLAWEGLLSLLFAGLIISRVGEADIKLYLSIYLLILQNSIVLSLIMLLAAKLIHRILPYQIFGSAFILMTGGLGFYNLLTGFYRGIPEDMVKFIPNSWFIKGFTDIIIYGGVGGYLKEGHRILFIMAIILVTVLTVIDFARGLHFKISKKAAV